METRYLFPNALKIWGWILFIPALLAGIFFRIMGFDLNEYLKTPVFAIYEDGFIFGDTVFGITETGFLDELLVICLIVGGILVGFSKLKIEDEYTVKIRYESLIWAMYFNFGLLLFFTLTIYGSTYFEIMQFNIFSSLLFFIIRFHYKIYLLNKSVNDEE
jgi:hypothetical protein